MERHIYERFTSEIVATAETHPDVLGLVAVGSMAGRSHSPDEWSDHDFWLVTRDGAAAPFREDSGWLPDAGRIVLYYRETAHGSSAVYEDGHLIEHAVFELSELSVARVNDYRVLVDKADIETRMEQLQRQTAASLVMDADPVEVLLGTFITQMVIGVTRHGRGEDLSAHMMVKGRAVGTLLEIITRTIEPVSPDILDDLDPTRRFERAHPDQAALLDEALRLPVAACARQMLSIALESLGNGADPAVAGAVLGVIDRASRKRPQ